MKLFILGLSFFIPTVVFSAGGDFVALTPIPGLNTGSGTTLVEYVNGIFTLVISLAAMLAVLRIVTGGFKYMTSEAVGEKGEARETIQGAVFGLVLLLGSWLILNTINPQILDLSTLQFKNLSPEQCAEGEGCAGDKIADIKERRMLINQKIADLTGEGELYNGTRRWITDASDLTSGEISAIVRGAERSSKDKECFVWQGTLQDNGLVLITGKDTDPTLIACGEF